MAGRCDESSRLDFSLLETETNHDRRLETATREDHVTTAILEVSSNPVWKITEGETVMAEESRFDESCLSRVDHVERNTEEHQFSHLMSSSMAEEVTPLVKPAADVLQKKPLFFSGASHEACLTLSETQKTDCRHFSVMDNHGKVDENADFLTQSMQKTYQKGDTTYETVESQQFMLRPPNDQTSISHQTVPSVESKEQKTLYHSVLHQMQQQQKHKPGRRFKKKTLMKMAKLFVITKSWDSGTAQTPEIKYSNGSLAEPLLLNQKEDMLISSVMSQNDIIEANYPKDRKNDCDKDTVISAVSTNTTFSGPTAAPQVTLKENSKTSSTCKKQAKKESNLSGAAETDCSTSTDLLDKSDIAQESLMYTRPVTASKKRRKLRKTVSFKEDPCDNSELARNRSAEISIDDPPKKLTSKRRKKTTKASKACVKKRTKQKRLPETLTESNDVMTQDAREGFLLSDFTDKNEKEATCTATVADIHSEEPRKSTEEVKRKIGRTFKKKTSIKKAELLIQEVEVTGEHCNISKEEVLPFQPPSVSQASTRGKQRKKKKTSPTTSVRRSPRTKHSKLKSVETVVTPEATVESIDFAATSSEVSFHTGNQDGAIQNTEDKTRPTMSVKKARKKRITTSRSKCRRGRQAVQQLSTEDISLQEQNETSLSKETTNNSNSQHKNPRKRAPNTKKCKAEAVNVPVYVPFCDNSTTNRCVSAEFLTQTSDIKTDPACEPVTQTLTKRRNTNTRRQQKKSAEKRKHSVTLNSLIKQESDGFDMQCATYNQKQHFEQETVTRNNSQRKYKGRGQRKRKKVENKAREQSLNSDLNIKSEPLWQVAPNQLDFPLIDIKNELDQSHSTPIKTQPHRKSKFPREYTTPPPEDSLISYLKGSQVRSFSKSRRTKGVKKEPMVNKATEKNGNISDEVLNAQDNLINSQTKTLHVKIKANQTLNAAKEEELISGGIDENNSIVKEVKANFENIKKFKGKKKYSAVGRRSKVAAFVEKSVNVMASGVQSVESCATTPSVLGNVSKNIKAKRGQKRKGNRGKKKLASADGFGEAIDIAPDPPVSSLNENVQEDVIVKSKRRCRRVKAELCTVSTVENNNNLEPEDNVSASLGVQTKAERCVTTRRGTQRWKSKCNMKTSAGSLSELTTQTEEVASDFKNVLMVSFGVDCEAPTGDLKWDENMKKSRKARKTSKKKTVMGQTNLESSEQQQPKCGTGVLVNQEIDDKSKLRGKRRKRKGCKRSGKVSKTVKTRGTFSCKEPVLACSSSIQDSIFTGVNLNAVRQEHNQSDISELTPSLSLVESSTVSERKPKPIRKRLRRKKTGWTVRKKVKQHKISAHCSNAADEEMFAFSFNSSRCNSESRGEEINDDKQSNNQGEETTAKAEVKLTSKLKYYSLHRQKLKSQKPLQCSFCRRSFRHITAFALHKRIHTGEKPYRCPTCGKNFARFSQMNLHSKIHSESRAVCCPCCGGKFKSKDELMMHFHVHMKDIQSSNVVEDMTGKGASQHQVVDCLDSPVVHNKPFRCSVCFKDFINRATFKMHRRTHGEKLHTCSVCGKKFCQSSNLNAHEKTHWPVKPYSCSVCCKGFVKLQELKCHSQMHSGATPFSCARCEKSFSSFASLRLHQVAEVCSDKQDRNLNDIDGFLVSQSAEGQIVTPVFFKCPICKQLHRHWCQYVLHLQIHTHSKSDTCKTCRQQYSQPVEIRSHCIVCCRKSGEERLCRSSLAEIWKEPGAPETQDNQSVPPDEYLKGQMSTLPQVKMGEKDVTYTQPPPPSSDDSSLSVNDDFDISALALSLLDQASQQPSRFLPRSFVRRYCGRYLCGHCGKSFIQWNKLWLHQRFHRQTGRAFSCTHCDLEFRFLGSYIDHLQEHAAQTPYACPLCPNTFKNDENLSVHISECHKKHDYKKCSTCGKNFSTLRNLKKHKLLHKGANSHFCLPCKLSFSSNSALKSHLKTHRTRLNVPQPVGVVEPLLFPYHCKKCTAKFSRTDLLQVHQVCHFAAGKKPETPTESIISCIPSRTPEDIQGVISELSQQKRRLPVSNKKHLFRYPHPDRLYVVPVVSSEPPVVISDTEEENTSITTSQPGASFNSSDSKSSNTQSSARTIRSKNQQQDHSDKSPFLPQSHQDLDFDTCDSDSAELPPRFVFCKEKELVEDTHSCAICMRTFTDISKLHKHYIDHARGDLGAETVS